VTDEWTEVNIVPARADGQAMTSLLIDLVDPLVHDKLNGRVNAWFYFWETAPIGQLHLRLRVCWQHPEDVDENRTELLRYLADARRDHGLVRSYEGCDGIEGETYKGEAPRYGPEVWEPTYRSWMSGSELALAILKAEAAGLLEKSRQFHWSRSLHLYSNQLDLFEVPLSSLLLARACLPALGANQEVANITNAINDYFQDT